MKQVADRDIWGDFKKGKNDALSLMYHQNVDFLFFYGKRYTQDEQLILDVIHDLFCYLIERKQRLGYADNIRMYLLKSFRRRLIAELDKKNKRKVSDESTYESSFVFSIEEELIIDEEKTEKQLEISKGLSKLTSKQREALFYKYNSGLDYEQICDIMGVSYSNARKLVSRSIQVVKSHMKERGFIFHMFLLKKIH